jgi:hypothetical protein
MPVAGLNELKGFKGGSRFSKLPQQAHEALIGKPILISRQASEHLNLDYRVKVATNNRTCQIHCLPYIL